MRIIKSLTVQVNSLRSARHLEDHKDGLHRRQRNIATWTHSRQI